MTADSRSGAPGEGLVLPSFRAERILSDEGGLLVVDKPAGIPMYGGPEGLPFGLTERLGRYLEQQGRPRRLGVHQRLDQATSGVCVLTTDPARDKELAQALEAKTLARTYIAVVEDRGRRLAASGVLRLRLDSDGDRSWVVSQGGQEAVTHYRVVERSGPRLLLELSLATGRLHQIRVSLAHLGAPVVGDPLYGGAPRERLCLHARALAGGPLGSGFDVGIPECFADALAGRASGMPTAPLATLRDAVTLRGPLLSAATAFRLVNADGDQMPGLTIDYYAGFAVMNVYDEHWLPHRQALAGELLQLGCFGVYEKRRLRADLRQVSSAEVAPDAPILGKAAPPELIVREGELSLVVALGDGLSTGLFVDQRDNHQKVAAWCAGGRMLNLFCYTGAFSVAAARVGARTTSVDLSAKALARARRNFEQNGLEPDAHRFIKEDAMKFLARVERRGEEYDLIVLDPPSFSTVGKGTFSVRGRYEEAVALCVRVLAPGGKLLCVTNHTKTSARDLREMLSRVVTASRRTQRSLRQLPAGLDCPPGWAGPFPSKSVLLEVE